MSPYALNGTLTTDKRTVDDAQTWDSQAEWEAYQSKNNINISNGVVELAQDPIPASSSLYARYTVESIADTVLDGTEITSLPDTEGANDLSGSATYVASGINGNRSIGFDGNSQHLSLSSWDADLGQPVTVAVALEFRSFGAGGVSDPGFKTFLSWGDDSTGWVWHRLNDSSAEWNTYSGASIVGGTVDSNPHGYVGVNDGASSLIEIDDTAAASGNAGSTGVKQRPFSLGRRSGLNDRYSDILMSEVLIYNARLDDATRTEVYNYLSGKWGV